MTELLKKAFAEAAKLPPEDQDALAAALLDDLESERAWERPLGPTDAGDLERLASEALDEYHSGKTTPLDPGTL